MEAKYTNYLDPKTFYGDFLDYLVTLDEFHDPRGIKLAISANEMYWAARIQYGSGLRISEVLNLVRSDFDLNHRILKLYNTKTGKGEIQKTSILPYDIPKLEKFLDKYGKSDRIFDTTRSTMWRYYKNTASLAGIRLFSSKKIADREGAYTHLLRESCSKMYEIAGARMGIIARKL
ncbi:MAG: site-specific integrase, partial [Thaumarchaeota archaeon]|nr:site-specific integrase [Nitrososphaerota archaeon]